MTEKTICGVEHSYVSPTFEVLEIKAEGVLCASGEDSVTVDDWRSDGTEIDF